MGRLFIGVFVALVAAFAQGAKADPELLRAARSPYELARYVNSHADIDWRALWVALGGAGNAALGCGNAFSGDYPCSAIAMTVKDPDQVIVILERKYIGAGYLRFQQDAKSAWRLTGQFEAYVKNHPVRHELFRFGGKPFLKVSMQGMSGSGLDSEFEDWFDLTLRSFEPVFGVTVQGFHMRVGFGPSSKLKTVVRSQVLDGGVEEIQVSAVVQFSLRGEQDLGSETFTGVYRRGLGQRKFSFVSATWRGAAMSETEFSRVANIPEEGPSNEKLLVYAFDGLKRVAAGKDVGAKNWLRFALTQCKDTPERRTLLGLLGKP